MRVWFLVMVATVIWSSAGAERFTLVLNGEAVLDARTTLVWEREPAAFHGTWMEAAPYCAEQRTGGASGWRVPTVEELKSLVEPEQHDPALPAGHPFQNIKSAIYWTATPSERDDIVAWHVSFLSGEAVTDQKSQTRRVWCVRDERGTR
ncbi:MAG TPA: DUF1566 domain-containing protein [Nitrospirales bacterium]|nr:DUF1566 domain-containing protein [Nitrospirales bacterium]